MTASKNDERREYFRIDDEVKLRYREVPMEELDERIKNLESNFGGSFNVMSSLSAISQKMVAPLHRLEVKHPDVAECLRAIECKIDTLGRAFLAQESDLVSQDAIPVNISAGGMSFAIEQPLDIQSVVEIRLLLLPSFTGILIYGDIIDCKKVNDQYIVRAHFSQIRDDDRDTLIRHILRKQGDILRERRERLE